MLKRRLRSGKARYWCSMKRPMLDRGNRHVLYRRVGKSASDAVEHMRLHSAAALIVGVWSKWKARRSYQAARHSAAADAAALTTAAEQLPRDEAGPGTSAAGAVSTYCAAVIPAKNLQHVL